MLFKLRTTAFRYKSGDRIAQLIIERILTEDFAVVAEPGEQTMRDTGGFGSTGMR